MNPEADPPTLEPASGTVAGELAGTDPKKSGRTGKKAFRRYVLRRIGLGLLLVWGVATLLFVVTQVVPGDPVALMLGDDAAHDERARQAIVERYGLDEPLAVQYVNHLTNTAQGDLGVSMRTRRPVSFEIARSLPATIELGLLAGLLAMAMGISLGIVAALNRDKFVDQFIRVASLTGISMPIFWTAMIALYVFHFRLGIFPTIGRLSAGATPPPHVTGAFTIDSLLAGDWETFRDTVSHLLLPALVLAAYTMTLLARFTRSAVLEILNEDYVRTARAKGLPFRIVINRHVLRAALVPIITVMGLMFTSVLTGTVLIEAIFGFPGLGNFMYQSALFLDMPGIVGGGLVIAVIYISINFVVDVLYGVIDPRIRLG